MSDTIQIHRPVLGRPGEQCADCGAPLAADQRYCLNCGARRAEARVPYEELLRAPAPVATPAPPLAPPRPMRSLNSAVAGMLGAAALGLGLLAGALIVRHNDDSRIVIPPPVVTVAPTAAATAAPTATVGAGPATFAPDWPAGQEGWTVQLQVLPKDGTAPDAVAAAKAAATAKGAPGVGALDSDSFPSLDGGNYVIYAGVASSKADAQRSLDGVRASFPDAKVVQVASAAAPAATPTPTPTAARTTTPDDAQKNIRKAPAKVESQGQKAKPDHKAPGDGSSATEIG